MEAVKQIECRYCENGLMAQEEFTDVLKFGRKNITVEGLLRHRCSTCDSVMTTALQYEHNLELTKAAEKQDMSYVPAYRLREFREKYRLSQRDAGRLLGVGEAAFGKYETGGRMSAPTAKLFRAADALPSVFRMLANEEGMAVEPAVIEDAWSNTRITNVKLVHSNREEVKSAQVAQLILGELLEPRWNKNQSVVNL